MNTNVLVPLPDTVVTEVYNTVLSGGTYETYSDIYINSIVDFLQHFDHNGVVIAGCKPWYISVMVQK